MGCQEKPDGDFKTCEYPNPETDAALNESYKVARTVPCDVILMDIEMETIDAGIRAAEVITARHPEVKILFLTAHETDDMITKIGRAHV